MSQTATVVLADDERLTIEGLATMLEDSIPGLSVVAIVDSLAKAKEAIDRLHPDLLITDLIVGGDSMLPAISEVIVASPGIRVLILSSIPDATIAETFHRYGAHGFLPKYKSTVEELVNAIRAVLRGQPIVERCSAPSDDPAEATRLSHRERKVLSLIAIGFTNAQIAKRLYLSLRTVEAHRAAIRSKLGLSTRAELTAFAQAIGLGADWPATVTAQDQARGSPKPQVSRTAATAH